jgi:phosphoglycolate phosphatase-like HAD superfamily hydrolase
LFDAVIFDLDGTLVDTNDAHVQAWQEAFRDLGHDVPRGRIDQEIGKGGDQLVPSILGHEGEARDGKALRTAHEARFLTIAANSAFRIFLGTNALLSELRQRGIDTAIATSSQQNHLDAIIASCGLDITRLVSAVITGSVAAKSKPAPDLVQAALVELGSDPLSTVMVGDTPYDGEASARAGVAFLGMLCGGRPAEILVKAGARALYANPAELLLHIDDALRLRAHARR